MSAEAPIVLRVLLGESVVLRLEHDPTHARPALAYGGDWALSYADRELPKSLRDGVLNIGGDFGRTQPSTGAEAIGILQALVAERFAGARLELGAPVRALPRWSGAIRSRAAGPGEHWPFDAELVGLRRGMRRLIKRDGLSPSEVPTTERWFEQHGLLTRAAPDSDDRRVVFAAGDAALLAAAVEAEQAISRPHGPSAHEAAAWMGDALGYPPCCVARFVSMAARTDAALAEALLPPVSAPPASALTLWLHPPLSLHSHAPCSLACEATRTRGEAMLAALDGERPGFAAWWWARARRLHVVDTEGRAYALAGEGALSVGLVVEDAIESNPRGQILRHRPDLVGATACIREQRLVLEIAGRGVTVIAADHRAD